MSDNEKNCTAFSEDLVALVDGELDQDRTDEVVAHMKECPGCQKVADDLRALGEKLAGWGAGEPSAEWERRAEGFVRERAARQAGRGGSRAFFGRPAFALAAAACLVLVIGIAGLFATDSGRAMLATSSEALSVDEEHGSSSQVYGHRSMKSFGPEGGGTHGYAPAPGSGRRASGTARPDQWNVRPLQPQPSDMPLAQPARDPYRGYGQVRPPEADRNGTFESSYRPGAGERERVEKLIASGVLVDGRKLELGAFTGSYRQNFKVPARTALALSCGLDHFRVLDSGGEVFLQVGIAASRREMSRRPPLNMALVIDRSGSMAEGDKMDSARRAALRFVADLRADDVVVVIAYDDRIEMAGPGETGQSKESLRRFIRSLSPRGATDIHGALDRAYREIGRLARPGLINTVLLMSDGLPTAGNTSAADIVELAGTSADHGISTTTVGVGLDYNDALMMGVARRGQGHYHFVKDASSIEPIFIEEFESLNRVVARALRLRIELADGVVLRRVLGSKELSADETARGRAEERGIDRRLYEELGIQTDRERVEEKGVKMMIPYFFSGDSHVVLLQLWVPPGTGRRRIATATLKYKDMLFSKNGMDEREAVIEYAGTRDELVASISRPVKKNLLGFRAGEALLAAAELVQSGRTRSAARIVDEQARFFAEAGRAWGDGQLTRDAELLGRYREVILSLEDISTAGRESLRAYLSKTMSHSGYNLVK